MTPSNPICVALDTPDLERARHLVRILKPHVGMVKLGMEFFYAHGRQGYEAVAGEGLPLFLDLKLHDIPNTVASALASLLRLEPKPAMINVHASGGLDMMKAARDAVAGQTLLLAVTILTSLSDDDIAAIGFEPGKNTRDHARSLAELALEAGLDGVVCSPEDVAAIKGIACGKLLTIVPGIRPADAAATDQKRVSTPKAALAEGADILVIGRPITRASDPAAAARSIVDSLR